MKPCIFIDIDGPLIPTRSWLLPNQTKPATQFDPIAVSMINDLIIMSDARLVISSVWRSKGLEYIQRLFTSQKLICDFHEDWCTQTETLGNRRHEDIYQWLEQHDFPPHVAIDDELIEHPSINAVGVSTQDGISFQNYLECRKILGID